jgi:hypothetical protein
MSEVGLTRRSVVQAIKKELVESNVDGDVVALHTGKSVIYGLNAVGSRVWELMAEPRSIDEICQQLCCEFDVDGRTCEEQVLTLVESLRVERLAEITRDAEKTSAATPEIS